MHNRKQPLHDKALLHNASPQRLRVTPQTVHWGYLDAALPVVLEIESGTRLIIDTVSGGENRLPPQPIGHSILADHRSVLSECAPHLGPHILTGPVGIPGAERGDLLEVEIEEISLRQDWAWNEICPGTGVLPEFEREANLAILPLDLSNSRVHLPWGKSVPARPFFGVMAVKPPAEYGRVTSLVPGCFGGNMDLRHLLSGTKVFFPVQAPGAGFSVGDGHALQGDGEVNGTAAETALTGTFRFTLHRQAAFLPFPFALSDTTLITLAVDEDLALAAREALRQAVKVLSTWFDLSPGDAYRHASLCGDLAITQMVNGKVGVHCQIAIESLEKGCLS